MLTDRPQNVRPVASRGGADGNSTPGARGCGGRPVRSVAGVSRKEGAATEVDREGPVGLHGPAGPAGKQRAGARPLTITRLVQCRGGERGKTPVMPRRAPSSRARGGRARRGRDPRVGRGASSSGRRAALLPDRPTGAGPRTSWVSSPMAARPPGVRPGPTPRSGALSGAGGRFRKALPLPFAGASAWFGAVCRVHRGAGTAAGHGGVRRGRGPRADPRRAGS